MLQPGDKIDMSPATLAQIRDLLPGEPHYDAPGFDIHVGCAISFTHGTLWSITIEQPRTTASGRKGKPNKIVNLVTRKEQHISELLRILADVFEKAEPIEVSPPSEKDDDERADMAP